MPMMVLALRWVVAGMAASPWGVVAVWLLLTRDVGPWGALALLAQAAAMLIWPVLPTPTQKRVDWPDVVFLVATAASIFDIAGPCWYGEC